MAVVTGAKHGQARARLRALSWRLAIVPLAAVSVALGLVFAAQWSYAGRTLPGLTVAGIDVGSLDRPALQARLDAQLSHAWAERSVVATHDGRVWRSTNGALGVAPDIAGAVEDALAYGKTGSLTSQVGAWIGALRGDADVAFTLRADGGTLDEWIAGIAADVALEERSGSLSLGDDGLVAIDPVVGRRLDRSALAAVVLGTHTLRDREIALPVRPVYPEVDQSGYGDAVQVARAITTPLDVVVEDRRIAEDVSGLSALVVIERVPAKPGELAELPAGAIAPAQRYRYVVSLDGARLDAWTAAMAKRLDRPAVDARFTVSREGALSVVPGVAGIQIDQDAFRALMRTELVRPAQGVRQIAAPSVADKTSFTTADAERWLPQLQRTSTFTTYFPVSASRHANISIGSSQFDGVVIKPGQTFSFWTLLGPVTVERGYAYAGAIIKNRSDENVIGGGLCQVSTTMFNAVARLGYRIDERHEHGYLIERYPIGLDAAVFDPGLDFRWTNDTGSPVFLWSWVSPTSVTFDVWGLPTGRTVTFTDPVQYNFVDVPPTQPADPAFPAGYAVRGRDVVRTRTVLAADGAVLYRDTFRSHYAPVWGGPAASMTVR